MEWPSFSEGAFARPEFVHILSQLSGQDREFLAWLYTQTPQGASSDDTPGSSTVANVRAQLNYEPRALLFTLVNLERQALVTTTLKDSSSYGPVGTPRSGLVEPVDIDAHGSLVTVTITVYGAEFVRAFAARPLSGAAPS
jgi:hypothetical protein